MKRSSGFRFIILFGLVVLAGAAHPKAEFDTVFFEPDMGQAGRSVQFVSRALRSTLYIMADGESLLQTPSGSLGMSLAGGSKSAGVGIEPLSGRTHHLIGRDPKEWRIDIRTYGAVKFDHVYPGIDLLYRGARATRV